MLSYFLPNLLARFKRSYPQVEIDLVDMDRPSIEQGITDGSLDLGLTIISNLDAAQPKCSCVRAGRCGSPAVIH